MNYIPPHNGGLYTGEPFNKGAPWANIPNIPDVQYLTNVTLKSANPPPQAINQYPGHTRIGNNNQINAPGLSSVKGFSCIEQPSGTHTLNPHLFKYSYL